MQGFDEGHPDTRSVGKSEVFIYAPRLDWHIFHILSPNKLIPNARVVQRKPEILHSQWNTEERQVFNTPTPQGDRPSQQLPINQVKLLFHSWWTPQVVEDKSPNLIQYRWWDREKSTPIDRKTGEDSTNEYQSTTQRQEPVCPMVNTGFKSFDEPKPVLY